MSIVAKLISFFGRLLGGRPGSAAAPAICEGVAATATAVAGFVHRVHVDRFRLAARLASVAKLNPPVGRLPYTAKLPPAYQPAVPAERIGAKKVRIAKGLRVLPQIQARNLRSADIIPFPVRRTSRHDTFAHAKAA